MTAPGFVDRNVLVYSRDARDAAKHDRARAWVEFLWETKRGRVSRQVLHEYYVTVTRKLRPGLSAEEARSDVRALFQWLSAVDPQVTIESAWACQDHCSISFWDARIVGAAQSLGCGTLLSEDLPAGQDIEGIRIIDPFATSPSDFAA